MTNLYQLTVTLFYQLANAFFWPVAVALLALLAITLIDLGGLFFTFWRKRRESRSDLPAIARALSQSETVEGALDDAVALAIAAAFLDEGGGAAEGDRIGRKR